MLLRSIQRIMALVGLSTLLLIGAAVAFGQGMGAVEIAYVAFNGANPDIFLTDLQRGYSHNLSQHDAYDGAPAWSPDGEWIAFQSDRGGAVKIYVMDSVGRGVRLLTDMPGSFTVPRWSRDGQRIVFFDASRANSLFSIRIDGTDLRQLTEEGVVLEGQVIDLAIEPNASTDLRAPNGVLTMFMRFQENVWGIYVTPQRRAEARLLAPLGRAYTELPVWSPASDRVAYIAANGARGDIRYDLYVIDVASDGSPGKPMQVTQSRQIESAPAWRP